MIALRAFEAAARHLSFTRAATELNLTQTAISHQIRTLEELLGIRLFVRRGKSLSLTDVAETYIHSVRSAIQELAAATERAADHGDENVLRVECLGTFAIKCLIPHLSDFRARYPRMTVRIRTVQTVTPTEQPDFDVAIWHGSGRWPGMHSVALSPEEVFPVCSPRLLREGPRLKTPEDLTLHTAIRTASLILRDEWPFWLEQAGQRDLVFADEISCDYLITSLEAAIDGLGIIMGRSSIAAPDLANGRLVAPFSLRIPSHWGYYVVSLRQGAELRKVRLFREWVLGQVCSQATKPATES